ncbi:MAG: type II secretion system F family protein [Patescibacteria group bacterium]
MKFKFKAKSLEGKTLEGTREASDKYSLSKSLKTEGYILIDFEKEGAKPGFDPISFFGRVSLSEKMIFTRNLAVMISAGLPISRALKILINQTKSKKFKKTLTSVSEDLTRGKNLSDSLSVHKKIFSKLYVSMIRAGEESGKIDESLKIMADQMEKDFALKRKVKGAMVYPSIIILAMIGIAILMLIYVVPTLVSTFEGLGVELPMSTQVIIWISDSLIANSLLVLGTLSILIVLFIVLLRSLMVKRIVDSIFLRTPLISPLIQKINSARTTRTLSSLIGSGVSILEALDMTAEVVQNTHYKKILVVAKKDIQGGGNIATAFKKSGKTFPPLVGEMVAVGEETGKLSEMLLRLAVFYEEEVANATKDMATVIEPILMIIIGAVVGFFAISMIKPMYSMLGGI